MSTTMNSTTTKSRLTHSLTRGVSSMAFTELWERFSFYGLQGILSFYLLYSLDRGGLALDPAIAAGIVGAYGGCVYLAQILGAWLGDRLITPQSMVSSGAVVITIGHLVLAFAPGITGLAIGLILIVLGTGALKTNITSIVGFVLENEGTKRDAGFSYFYMAINAGAVLGPLSTGFAQNQFGFHYGFGLAAIGMFAALLQYNVSKKNLPDRARTLGNPLPKEHRIRHLLLAATAVVLLVLAIQFRFLNENNLVATVTTASLVAAVAYFVTMLRSKIVTGDEKRRVAGFIPMFIAGGIYFGFLFQKFTAISILITQRIDLSMGSWSFPVAWITTMSPLAAVLVTPLIARLWNRLGSRQPGPATKFALGLTQIGCAYLFLLLISEATGDAYIPLALILLFMMMAGSSEVFIGPIGLSLATKIGPEKFKTQMVGLNFLTLALGSSLSGLLGQVFTKVDNATYFTLVAAGAIVLGATLFLARSKINHLLGTGTR